MNTDELMMEFYELRERMTRERHRPRYHFLPPAGRWNDLNGMLYWNGLYHSGYLQKIANGPGERDFSSQQHISSRDLLHWRYHPTALREPLAGTKGDYFNTGAVIRDAEVPTIITNMPRQGICIYRSFDENLDTWVGLPENPVIPIDSEFRTPSRRYPECVIFDPSGWKEGDAYYALIGNRNFRPGYEGDSTSLFTSENLVDWEYLGPFYRSSREWTDEVEDCACSDFFPFGERYMLVMHTHRPFAKCQYYLGRYEDHRFTPEHHGQLSWLGSMVFGPKTLLDDRDRRVFMATVGEASGSLDSEWRNVMTLPWHFSPDEAGLPRIDPISEISSLRYDEISVPDMTLRAGDELRVPELDSSCEEVQLTLSPDGAREYGIKLLCSPDGEEQTVVLFDSAAGWVTIDFDRSSRDRSREYVQAVRRQVVPFTARELHLDIFVDRSIIEIFVNSRIVLVQRVYPMRDDSTGFRVFSRDGALRVRSIRKWEMDATNPW